MKKRLTSRALACFFHLRVDYFSYNNEVVPRKMYQMLLVCKRLLNIFFDTKKSRIFIFFDFNSMQISFSNELNHQEISIVAGIHEQLALLELAQVKKIHISTSTFVDLNTEVIGWLCKFKHILHEKDELESIQLVAIWIKPQFIIDLLPHKITDLMINDENFTFKGRKDVLDRLVVFAYRNKTNFTEIFRTQARRIEISSEYHNYMEELFRSGPFDYNPSIKELSIAACLYLPQDILDPKKTDHPTWIDVCAPKYGTAMKYLHDMSPSIVLEINEDLVQMDKIRGLERVIDSHEIVLSNIHKFIDMAEEHKIGLVFGRYRHVINKQRFVAKAFAERMSEALNLKRKDTKVFGKFEYKNFKFDLIHSFEA